jgi:cytochrome c553
MRTNRFALVIALLAAASALWAAGARGAEPVAAGDDAAATDFFEKRVRPLLVEHCHECHGAKKQEAGLRLDSGAGIQKGGDTGPVLAPGDPENSLLVAAIRYDDEPKMPPEGKLADRDIETLVTWIKLGAKWPTTTEAGWETKHDPLKPAAPHWAFQPVRDPAVSAVRRADWIASPIDAFVLSRLEEAGLGPSAPADRRTLIRRATFDLHGLPPSAEEVAAFEADSSPNTYARLIDRLLESPRYGERWGRYWLDVARYADTKGYVRLNENPRYTSSWTYRDYVIRAFNEDLPYDRFITEQLAADQLALGDDPRPLAALGYLTLGQRFLNSQHDIIDDRIDVVTRGLMGLTVACARCHDHKFDPIPTRDYYSLHGVFASSIEPRVPPLIVRETDKAKYESYLVELEKRTGQLNGYLLDQQELISGTARSRAAEYLLTGQNEPIQANFIAVMFLVDANRDLNPAMTQRWARFLEQTRKHHHPVLAPWNDLARLFARLKGAGGESLASAEIERRVVELVSSWRSASTDNRTNPLVVEAISSSPPHSPSEAAGCYGRLFESIDKQWEEMVAANSGATSLADPNAEEIRQLLYGDESPFTIPLPDLDDFIYVDATKQNQLHAQQKKVEDWVGSADAAPHAMSLIDAAHPADSRISIRGNASNPGDVAPRRFLSAISQGDPLPLTHGSGRLDLAEAIVSPDNPLTRRVIVNRVWMQHFGTGLVRTPSDFGTRGDPPTHPELLDHLATEFLKDGWSIKSLHRAIMLSSTYQQQSDDATNFEKCSGVDSENNLLWRANRRRLDWESFRDSLIAVAGDLDLAMGGPSVDLLTAPYSKRRTVYGLIDRQNLPSTMRTFDFAPPDASSPQRHQTTVPQQSLFLMNSPFLKERAQVLEKRIEGSNAVSSEEKTRLLYALLFNREPDSDEVALAKSFLDGGESVEGDASTTEPRPYLNRWEEYVQTLLLSNEFVFVD